MTDRRPLSRGLGRGLSALMADVMGEGAGEAAGAAPERAVTLLAIEQLEPNPGQPRRSFAPEALAELTASIRDRGILQPLIVRPRPDGRGYQIVAGERRWRAAQAVPLHEVPVIVRDYSDREVLEVAIIENIQRADLDPVDEAMAYRALIERFGHTQERVAEALGKSRSHIANAMRLLQLPLAVLEMLRDGRLTAGHARALITLPDPVALAERAAAGNLTVREVEDLARRGRAAPPAGGRPRAAPALDADTAAIEADLSAALGLPVRIRHSGSGGEVTIAYGSLGALDLLCEALSRARRG